jgi:hypothetical protein
MELYKTIQKGSIYIDNTTASATIAREFMIMQRKMDLVH